MVKNNSKNQNQSKIKNKGTGAGGSNTNVNGLNFENKKDISSEYTIVENNKNHQVISFNKYPNIRVITGKQTQFIDYLEKEENEHFRTQKLRLGGTKWPDKWFIINDVIFIVELKFQQGSGSVCEKLQTPVKKIEHLKERYPKKKIVYVYGLHNWFKKNAKPELYYLEKDNIPVFWGDSNTFKEDIIDYIINYK